MCSCFRGVAVPLPPVVDKEWILGSSDELIYIPYRYAREEEVWSFLIVSPMDLRASCINHIGPALCSLRCYAKSDPQKYCVTAYSLPS